MILNENEELICKKSLCKSIYYSFIKGNSYTFVKDDVGINVKTEQGSPYLACYFGFDKFKDYYYVWDYFYKPGELRQIKLKTII